MHDVVVLVQDGRSNLYNIVPHSLVPLDDPLFVDELIHSCPLPPCLPSRLHLRLPLSHHLQFH